MTFVRRRTRLPYAGDGVPEPQVGFEAFRDRDEQLVARLVAQGIVHRLEAVQVQVEDREVLAVAVRPARDGPPEPVTEQGAVRQVG